MAFTTNQNEFLYNISNLIFTRFINDTVNTSALSQFLAVLNRGVHKTDNIIYTTTNLLDEFDYNDEVADGRTLLTINKPDLHEQQILLQKRKFIQITLENFQTEASFINEGSLQNLMSQLLSTIAKTKTVAMFDRGIDLLTTWSPAKPSQTVTVDLVDLDNLTTIDEKNNALEYNANNIFKTIKNTSIDMQYPTSNYNDLTLADTNNKPFYTFGDTGLVIFMNSKYNTNYLVDALIKQFNSDKMGLPFQVIELPESFITKNGNENTICFISDAQKFGIWDRWATTTNFFDAFNLNTSTWHSYAFGTGVIKALNAVKIIGNII